MQKFLGVLEKGLIILGVLFFAGAFTKFLPSSAISLIRYLVWVFSSFLILLRLRKALYVASQDKPLWLLILIVVMSFIWSDYPNLTLANSREVLQMVTFSWYFASRFRIREQIHLLATALGIGNILSVFVSLALPVLGRMTSGPHAGAWTGIYGHKNAFGSLMVISLFVFYALPTNSTRDRILKWGGFSLSFALILLSTSKTSLSLSILVLLMLFLYSRFRWQGKITVLILDIAILVLGSLLVVIVGNWVEILTGLGRDPTLTGRIPIWSVALTRFIERPWLGFGRGAFWAPGSPYALEAGKAVAALNFIPPHAHNGFIDLLLDVGLIGFGCFVVSFLGTYIRAIKRAYTTKEPENLWPLAFLTLLVLNNMTESLLLYLNNLFWVIYVTLALSLRQTYNLRNQNDTDNNVMLTDNPLKKI